MTCIVGMIDRKTNKVIIGADSAASTNDSVVIRKDTKVFKKGAFVIGCTSSFRMIQLLRFKLVLPDINDKDIYEYLCTDFIDAVRECFSEGGFLQKDKDNQELGGQFLVGYKDRLFMVDSDFQVAESDNDYSCIGCGESYAMGALYAVENEEINAYEKVYKALHAAALFSPFVGEPFYCESTN